MTDDVMTEGRTTTSGPAFAPAAAPPRRGLGGGALVVLMLLTFAAGVVAAIYGWRAYDRWAHPTAATAPAIAQPLATGATPPLPATGAAMPAAAAPATIDGLAAREAALTAQLAALEARAALLDTASRAAAGQAQRADRLFILAAVRRAIQAGEPLGAFEGALHTRFDAIDAQAVNRVVSAARQPVTLEDLREAIEPLLPTLASAGLSDGVWSSVRRELASLLTVRRATTPSQRAPERLARVRRALDAGNVAGAAAEVARMPGTAAAAGWLASARRYVDARQAITQLEAATLAAPGAPPQQPPVGAAAPASVSTPH